MENELKSLDAVEVEIRARYNGKYQSAPKYQTYGGYYGAWMN